MRSRTARNANRVHRWRYRWFAIKRIWSRFRAWFYCGNDMGVFVMLADSVNLLRKNGYSVMTKSELTEERPELVNRVNSLSIGNGGYSWVCFDNESDDPSIYIGDSQNAVVGMAMSELGDWLSH